MTYAPHRLIEFLEAREDWAFGYGPEPRTHDCARFAGAGVEAAFGVNPLKAFSSQWTTRRGARRVLARHGGMAAAVSEVMTPIDVTQATRGCVGMTAENQLVLFEGDQIVGLDPVQGYARLPRAMAIRAWTV